MGPKDYVGCCLILQIERNIVQYQNKGWTKDGRQSLVNSYLNGSFHGIFYFIYQTVLKYYKINYNHIRQPYYQSNEIPAKTPLKLTVPVTMSSNLSNLLPTSPHFDIYLFGKDNIYFYGNK